jgi:DNA-binding NarL/FixJ family response regulator
MTKSTRVLVVDDHDLFRVGLASALATYEDIEVVAQASGGRMAVRLAAELRPDVILMDLRMPDLDGLEATREILEADPSARVVAVTVATGETDVAAAIAAGASGYLTKDSPVDDVITAIRAAASGSAWLSPRAARAVLDRMRREHVEAGPASETVGEELSPRELQVLELVARGLDNNKIAAELYISPCTAKNHVSSILAKLGVTNRIQAAAHAWRRRRGANPGGDPPTDAGSRNGSASARQGGSVEALGSRPAR